MTPGRRRLMLGIGAALLVGGWGATRYAAEQQQAIVASGVSIKLMLWTTGSEHEDSPPIVPTRVVYGAGVLSMAIGAGLIGFAVLREK